MTGLHFLPMQQSGGGGEFDDKSLKYIDEIAAELTSQTVSREDLAVNISILIITMRHMVLY